MKQFILLAGILVSACSIASAAVSHQQSINALGGVWKNHSNIHLTQNKNPIEMVYGGQDIAAKTALVQQIATA